MRSLEGKTVLLGLTTYDQADTLVDQQQFVGVIEKVTEDRVVVLLNTGERRTVPLDWKAIWYAPRGEYSCRATGERVTDPDYLSSWRIRLPAAPNEPQEWAPNYAPLYHPQTPPEWDVEYRFDEAYVRQLIDQASTDYIGGHLLIGITHYQVRDGKEEFQKQEQVHGKIVRVSYNEGIVVQLPDGQEHKLPPDLSVIEPAPPGEYHLRSTGEVVTNPDFMTTWTKVQH